MADTEDKSDIGISSKLARDEDEKGKKKSKKGKKRSKKHELPKGFGRGRKRG